jgi:fatty-acyl-CoA synthase
LPHHALIGGSAPAEALIAALVDEYGIEVRHAWGMTEIPVGVINVPKREETAEQRNRRRIKQGRPVPGIEVRIVGEHGGELPWDGVSFGSLWVRGHWVCAGYLSAAPTDTFGPDGWLATGDVATIDADGYVQIVDRVKDMVKSGGEWISSIELENLAAGHPQVKEAAVIGVAHEKWGERPVLIAVCHPGSPVSAVELIDYLRPCVAKWWLPDEVIFAEELPRTATGKVSKTRLRSLYGRASAGS